MNNTGGIKVALSRTLLVAVLLAGLSGLNPGHADDDDIGAAPADTWLHGLLRNLGLADNTEPDDDDEDDGASRMVLYHGQAALRLTAEEQEISDVGIEEVSAVRQLLEDPADARVVDLEPLLSLRSRYSGIAASASAANARLANLGKRLQGLRELNREQGSVATQRLSETEAEIAVLHAGQVDTRHQLAYLRDQAIHQWGEQIVDWALDSESIMFKRLLSREYVLLEVILRPGRQLSDNATFIFVDGNNRRQQARKAYRISPAPHIAGSVQGETWYFRTHGDHLRTGMRLNAWVPQPEAVSDGVFIPSSAVIWHESRPWVYLCSEQQYFIRVPLLRPRPHGTGWFVPEGIESGARVVTRGAQTLYSEEFRAAIPDEDDD